MKTKIFFIEGYLDSFEKTQEKIKKIEAVGGKINGPVQFLINTHGYTDCLITASIPKNAIVK